MLAATDSRQQLDQLLGAAIADFDIPDEVYERVVARYEGVGTWLSDYWDDSRSDGVIYPQGSIRLGTVVQPINPHDDYDIDLVCRRDLAKESTTQAALKGDVGRGLGLYVASGPDGTPTREEGKRCWTLDYPFEPFHMDVLPALPDTAATPNGILLTDRELREWQHSNPIDYASWFHQRMRQEFVSLREALAKQMDVDDVPEWKVKTTLQRAVQALKRHRDYHFADDPDNRPASIIVSTLAARAYAGDGPLYEVLLDVTSEMASLVERRDGIYWVPNPVQPKENFADRWQTHPERARCFFDWVERAQADFRSYGAELGVDRLLVKFARNFGERSSQRAGELLGGGLARARDAGTLGMAAGSGFLGRTATRPVPKHTFHGDDPTNVS
jgi:Cyclic GMP-AMP synthase DncV-like, nucleotidyltransferase domain